jgi:hypothetical protein
MLPSLSFPMPAMDSLLLVWALLPLLGIAAMLSPVAWPALAAYLLVRGFAQDQEAAPRTSPQQLWAETCLALVAVSLVMMSSDSELAVFALLCVYGIFRMRAPSRLAPRTKAEQWTLVRAGSALAALAVLASETSEPRAGDKGSLAMVAFAVLVALLARHAATQDPSPGAGSDVDAAAAAAAAAARAQPFSIAIPQVRVAGSFAEFHVVCKCQGQEWSAWRRYSSFRAFRHHLDSADAHLPGKKWVFNLNAAVLETRRQGLEEFLRAVFANDPVGLVARSHEARAFVGAPAIEI